MTETLRINPAKTPWPFAGGKADAAELVWRLLGDVPHYVEPFAGSLAVLLRRPHPANRTYYSETVNDADGLVVNFWRALAADPDAVAEAASWPVTEADKHARSCEVLAWAADGDNVVHLMGESGFCDARIAGLWAWCVSVTIGTFGSGGPWWPDEAGRLRRWQPGEPRPGGVSRELPHLTSDGQGVARPQLREPGVSRELPHLGDNGQGVNHAATREPGVADDDLFHPIVMPQLRLWLRHLAARLRHVRVLNGDWSRAVGTGASLTLPVRQGKGPVGIFLDPPYANAGRADGAYRGDHDNGDIAADAARWAVDAGTDPRRRIVAAGYADDAVHGIYTAAGWSAHDWHTDGWLTGGYGNQSHRERLYASPHCLPLTPPDEQGTLL